MDTDGMEHRNKEEDGMTGAELKAWRTKRKLTQEGLARLLGVTSTTVYRWEIGRHKVQAFLPAKLATLKLK
jgi:DNA-binding transcriptional regulator YiaG